MTRDAISSDPAQNLAEAEHDLERAKAKFFDTLGKIEHSFSPAELVDHAGDAISAKLLAVGQSGMDQAKKRPFAVAAGLAAVAAFFARRSLWKALGPTASA
jgi:hypothetical protein